MGQFGHGPEKQALRQINAGMAHGLGPFAQHTYTPPCAHRTKIRALYRLLLSFRGSISGSMLGLPEGNCKCCALQHAKKQVGALPRSAKDRKSQEQLCVPAALPWRKPPYTAWRRYDLRSRTEAPMAAAAAHSICSLNSRNSQVSNLGAPSLLTGLIGAPG